jgi:hypothetical protein
MVGVWYSGKWQDSFIFRISLQGNGQYSEKTFSKKLFQTALILRVVGCFLAISFYLAMTGAPYEFSAADVYTYEVSQCGDDEGLGRSTKSD